ncbi:MAG: YceG family protein [Culicoidibacterales bacterium]
MQIPEIMIELQRFEELFPLPIQSRQTILALEQPGYFSGRILGSFEDETRYFNLLYDYSQQRGWYVLHQFNVKSQITTPETISKIQAVLQSSVTIEQLVMHLLGENILPLPAFASSNDHYFQAYCHVFEHLLQAELSSQQVIETILYLQKYLPQLTEGDYLNLNWPKYVWYGPMTAAQAGLCLTVMLLHCDVLIFSPNQRDYFQEIFPNAQMVSQVYTLPLSIEVALFPTKKRAIVATSAQQAAQQLEQAFGAASSGFYRPWQFRHYQTKSIQLTTTFDEVNQYLSQQALLRPGFRIEQGRVEIPVLFTKINGIETTTQFSDTVGFFRNLPNTIVLEKFPFMPAITANYRYYLEALQAPNGLFLGEEFLRAPWWRYQSLAMSLQKKIIQAIVATLEDEHLAIGTDSLQEQQADVLGVLIDLPDPFIKQLEQFDYTREIPKVITLQTQISGLISREDAVVLRFLHHLGYDIISLNPSSRSDVDRYLQEGTMQIHQLPQHWFEYPNPPKVARKRKWWPWQRQSKVGE